MARIFYRRDGEVLRHGLYADEMSALATYNAECYRGIIHTPEYDAKMAELQARFDAAYRQDT